MVLPILGSDPECYPGQRVFQVNSRDRLSMLDSISSADSDASLDDTEKDFYLNNKESGKSPEEMVISSSDDDL